MRPDGSEGDPANLDELVTVVATELMAVDSATLASVARSVLRTLVAYFGVDLSFLRFHDRELRASVLVAEWPPREHVPDPDPLGVVRFADADPSFAASEHLADVLVIRPDPASAGYQRRVRAASGVESTSVATVPLRSHGETTGTLGFIGFGDRGWSDDEIRALRTLATLLAQVQARLLAEDRLVHLAHHDELTGLPNRRALMARLDAELRAPDGAARALLFVDVDRLKAMNDLLGHAAGDQFITAVAARLRTVVGADDLIARLGGDEFVVAVAGPFDAAATAALAAAIQRAVAEPIVLAGQALSRTVSVGVAVAPTGGSVSGWLRDADQAVLAAKSRGGNAVVTFTEVMRAHDSVRTAVEVALPGAIRDGSLRLHYQPVVDLRTREVLGVEALLRGTFPGVGVVSPELFVGVAEATNQAVELGTWVLDEACRQLAAWRAAQPGGPAAALGVSVNLSPVQLIGGDLVDTVARVLDTHGLAGADLTLEVTEHGVVSDEAAALLTLRGLRGLGVAVAIDDFGTGYSSLSQLKALPVTVLKIDQGFVRDLGTSSDDLAIVRSIVALATAFGLDLVAEGVESEDAATILRDLGCRRAQGYLYAEPLAPDALLQLIGGAAVG
ncbi:putative bifunctional diguanylate cyclase/phosphodiesterase [Rhodococcus aerolatus]